MVLENKPTWYIVASMTRDHRDEMARQFGENVRRYRDCRGFSQADLAQEMAARGWDWYQSTVFKVENAERRTETTEAYDLARILGVPLDRLHWPAREQSELGLVDRAAAALHIAARETGEAAARLLSARRAAERRVEEARGSEYERVRIEAEALAADLNALTLEAAVEDGTSDAGEEGEG